MYVLDIVKNKTSPGDVIVGGFGIKLRRIQLGNLKLYMVRSISKKGNINAVSFDSNRTVTFLSFMKLEDKQLEEEVHNKVIKLRKDYFDVT